MTLRSFLFVPGDSEKKLARGDSSGADALIIDLEDSVAPERKVQARCLAREYLAARHLQRSPEVWVRLNPIDNGDLDGLHADSIKASREGFTGRMAIHPDQIAPINAAFSPSEDDVRHARRVVEAFAAVPGTSVVGLDGKMLDIPHLKQAEQVLARSAANSKKNG